MRNFVFVFFPAELAPLNYVFIPHSPKDVAIYTNALSDIYASLLLICFCMQNMDVQLLLSFIHCLAHFKRETYLVNEPYLSPRHLETQDGTILY